MKQTLVTGISALCMLCGCATIERAGTLDNYTACAAADVITTAIGQATPGIREINPITKALTVKGVGHVMGTVIPVIGLSVAGYYLLRTINHPKVTGTVAALTCFGAARNLYIMR